MPPAQAFHVREHVWIPTADSVRLSARLWLPVTGEAVPAVLEYIPYRKRDGYRLHDNAWGAVLASAGIAFARVDLRGSGDSEGVLTDEYSEQELDDGVGIINWLANQDWCNGNVGMRGISWGAINTLQIAARQPPALKAIVPIAGTDSRYADDAHYHGGLLGRANVQWGVLFKLVMAGPPDPEVVGERWLSMWRERLEATPAIITRWLEHQRDDEYWQRGSVALDYAAVSCPAYVVAGWHDTYSNPAGRLLEHLQVPRKGLIGPWGHTYPELANPGRVDWAREEVRWWRHWLLGEATGIMAEPDFRTFLPEATASQSHPQPQPGRWVGGHWPPAADRASQIPSGNAAASASRLWLGSRGLERQPGAPRELVLSAGHRAGGCRPEWLNRPPVEQTPDDALSTCFDSPPLEQDLDLLGYPVAHLQIASDQPVAGVALRLTDVTPAGESWLVSTGVQSLNRVIGEAPAELIPGQPYEVRIPLSMMAYRFRAGHKLRVAVSAGLWPMTWPEPVAAQLTLTAGVSCIELPLWHGSDAELEFDLPHAGQPGRAPSPDAASRTQQADGSLVYEEKTPAWEYVDADTGTRLSGSSDGWSQLSPGGASLWRQQARRGWQRDGWRCDVTASCELTADESHFRVRESLQAFHDGAVIFEQQTNQRVARRLL